MARPPWLATAGLELRARIVDYYGTKRVAKQLGEYLEHLSFSVKMETARLHRRV